MSCESIMLTNPIVLQMGDTVATALFKLSEHRIPTLPVVDEQGRFLGLFGSCQMLGLLLPKAATWDDNLSISDIGFLPETVADLHQRLAEVQHHAVTEFMDTKACRVHPHTPLMEALLMLRRSATVLPVVDKADGTLRGIITSGHTLAQIAG